MAEESKNQYLDGMLALTRLKHVVMTKKGKTGDVEGLFIPIKANNLEVNEFETKDKKKVKEIGIRLTVAVKPETDQYNQDGYIRKSTPTEIYKKANEQEKDELQKDNIVLTNLIDWSRRSGGGGAPTNNNADNGKVFNADEDDDLPF